MNVTPHASAIERRGRGVRPADEQTPPPLADWAEVSDALSSGQHGPFWLSATRDAGSPHVRPVFAAWAGSSFYFASNRSAAKSRHLDHHPHAVISVGLDALHVVVEGRADRVTDSDGLRLASEAMQDVFGWPTRVLGDELDADYGAPTSGGPPYRIDELVPFRAYGFPMHNQVQPTRWTFESRSLD